MENDPGQSAETPRDKIAGSLQIALVVGVLVAGFAANAILSSSASAPRQSARGAVAIPVEVMVPEIVDKPFIITETGVIQSRNSINLSPQVSGRVVRVSPNLASGGYFEAGDELFRLDDANYRAALERARADVSSAAADLRVEQAEAEVAIQEWGLVHPGEDVPPLVAREPQISQAEAAVQSAQAALAEARLDLSRISFSLPFAGRITSTTIEVGQNLSAGQSYGSAYDDDDIEVSIPISAQALSIITPVEGRPARVYERGPPQRASAIYSAQIVRADAELDAETRLARVILSFTEAVPLLPGAFIEAEIEGPILQDAHLIPEASISENRVVWVVENGQLARREPRLFFAEDSMVATAPFDIADGVITSPLSDPQAGAAVDIIGMRADENALP